MKVKNVYTESIDDFVYGATEKEAIEDEMNEFFANAYEDLYGNDFVEEGCWDSKRVLNYFQPQKNDSVFVVKEQYHLLYDTLSSNYTNDDGKIDNLSAKAKQKITNFILKHGTTFETWKESPEGETIRDEILYDMAERQNNLYTYYGVRQKDFY